MILRRGDASVHVFLFPAIGSDAAYRPLAAPLPAGIAVYAFDELAEGTVVEQAASCAAGVRQMAPQGPYALAGCTFMCLIGLTFLVVVLFQQAATVLPITMGKQGLSSTDYGLALSLNGLVIVVLQIPLTRVVRNKKPPHVVAVAAFLCGRLCPASWRGRHVHPARRSSGRCSAQAAVAVCPAVLRQVCVGAAILVRRGWPTVLAGS